MKQQVILYNDTTVLFEGRISDIPILEQSIIQRSVELFDDEDPCVIHQSYVIKDYVDSILMAFESQATDTLDLDQTSFPFLDLPSPSGWKLKKKG